ncbi:tryptophan synthase beta subunit-like PLP-dependent enzyme [Gaertneriomyces semiglobifer]|nr:tryptophan synthase beta subunit-like PLP-dependent enzyme [Gaertneriomyces semiglobifer]
MVSVTPTVNVNGAAAGAPAQHRANNTAATSTTPTDASQTSHESMATQTLLSPPSDTVSTQTIPPDPPHLISTGTSTTASAFTSTADRGTDAVPLNPPPPAAVTETAPGLSFPDINTDDPIMTSTGGEPEIASVLDEQRPHITNGSSPVNDTLPFPATPSVFPINGPALFPNPNYGSDVHPPNDAHDYLRLILTSQIYDLAHTTPLQPAVNLSARLNNTILLKREDLQPVFSFKIRGAYNKMKVLSAEEKKKGVIACSAGNHAQGVAIAAKKLGVKSVIVMPTVTPPIKWRNVERLGAQVVLKGDDFDAAKTECARLCEEHGYTNIPPFDDPYVIAGQGTIALELLRQHPTLPAAVFVAIGGGGLASGIASYIKRIHPHIKLIGVETYDAAAMTHSLQAGHRIQLPQVGLFADGAAVKVVGRECFRICRSHIDMTVLVSTDEICAGIKDIFEDTRSVVEPAGALAVAGMKKYIQKTGCTGETFIAITSGANMNFDRLRFVAERAEIGENREALISVLIPERPGSFMELYKTIHPRAVSEFSYRFSDTEQACIFMSFMVGGQKGQDRDAELRQVFEALEQKGMKARDASHDELAKSHARYMIGGHCHLPDERVFRFAFPERPGALRHFLTKLNGETGPVNDGEKTARLGNGVTHSPNRERRPLWNVSMFHYRNHGDDVSKVLVGVQVPKDTEEVFEEFLHGLGYPYVEETGNEVYRQFLR